MKIKPSNVYTSTDHEFRSLDQYALAKYQITTRWLKSKLKHDAVILNIGCGAGDYFSYLEDLKPKRIVGFEPDSGAREIALRRYAKKAGIEIYAHTLQEIPSEFSGVDCIIMHDVLEHIKNDLEAIAKVFDLLNPGGVLCISVPALPFLFGIHDEQLGHLRRYTKSTLLKLINSKFHINHLRYFGVMFVPITCFFSYVLRKTYPIKMVGSSSLLSRIVLVLCYIEKQLNPPFGTSLLGLFVKR